MFPTLLERARRHGARTALLSGGDLVSYAGLLDASGRMARRIGAVSGDSPGRPVAFLFPQGWEYVAALWGIWRSGGMAVPLSPLHPAAESARILDDAVPAAVVLHPLLAHRVEAEVRVRGIPVVAWEGVAGESGGPSGPDQGTPGAPDPALMLYTSGTTGRPKGVVLTHGNLEAQVRSMVEAWEWTADDRILTHLPLHHVHGIVNVLCTALWCGATGEILPSFDAASVWNALARGGTTLYMAVPTVYRRLLEAWDAAPAEARDRWAAGARRCRLMVSGSAALPVPTLERWEEVTGQRLLERYGMTEMGMALSNPLRGERRPGFVGRPMPGVDVRLVDESGEPLGEGVPGEIQVRGDSVFREYWRRPAETREAFAPEGWFRTGDLAVVEAGAFRILGRMSQDILKTGGEKVSALEIEDVLRGHPGVADCAVVGVPDPVWGERVCAAVIPAAEDGPVPDDLRAFAKERLAPYKVPREIRLTGDLPRNAMGKVTKAAVRELFLPSAPEGEGTVSNADGGGA